MLPASFKFLDTDPQVVLPLRLNRANAEAGGGFGPRGVARLKPGVTLAQANDDIARMIPLIAEQFPLQPGVTQEMWQDVGLAPNVRPLSEDVIGEMSRPLWILLGTVGVVLLMAWTNVANLLLVRAEGRQREFAVRSGARREPRPHCHRAVVGEPDAGAGRRRARCPVRPGRHRSAAKDGACRAAARGRHRHRRGGAARHADHLGRDQPAVRPHSRPEISALNVEVLKEAGRSASDAPGRHRTRNALVVAQVALALVLLVVSGLMARTFVAMRQVQPGFVRPAEVQTFHIALPAALVRDPQQVARTYEQIAERLKQVPGVAAVGLANIDPDGRTQAGVRSLLRTGLLPERLPYARQVDRPGYFETMGNPLVAGRAITWTDIHQPTPRRRFRRILRANTGESQRRRSASGSGRPESGPKSSASSGTYVTTA